MPGIRRFKERNFPLIPAQKEEFRSKPAIKVQRLKGHEYLKIQKGNVYRAHVYGGDRKPINIRVADIVEEGGSTFIILEREHDE